MGWFHSGEHMSRTGIAVRKRAWPGPSVKAQWLNGLHCEGSGHMESAKPGELQVRWRQCRDCWSLSWILGTVVCGLPVRLKNSDSTAMLDIARLVIPHRSTRGVFCKQFSCCHRLRYSRPVHQRHWTSKIEVPSAVSIQSSSGHQWSVHLILTLAFLEVAEHRSRFFSIGVVLWVICWKLWPVKCCMTRWFETQVWKSCWGGTWHWESYHVPKWSLLSILWSWDVSSSCAAGPFTFRCFRANQARWNHSSSFCQWGRATSGNPQKWHDLLRTIDSWSVVGTWFLIAEKSPGNPWTWTMSWL